MPLTVTLRLAVVLQIQLQVVGVEGVEDATVPWSRNLFGVSADLSSAGCRPPAPALAIGTSIDAGWRRSSGCSSNRMSIYTLKSGV